MLLNPGAAEVGERQGNGTHMEAGYPFSGTSKQDPQARFHDKAKHLRRAPDLAEQRDQAPGPGRTDTFCDAKTWSR